MRRCPLCNKEMTPKLLHQGEGINEYRYYSWECLESHTNEQLNAVFPEIKMNKIYIASKAHHRSRWREMRELGYKIISRWIDVDDKYSEDPKGLDYERLWIECVEDVMNCDALVVYAQPGEVLKGAILEVGVALAMNKLIIAAGPREAFLTNGTWINHPLIIPANPGMTFNNVLAWVSNYGQEG